MKTDLVKQLRIMGAWFASDGWTANAAIATGAADEIERLRVIASERMDLFKRAASRVEELEAAVSRPQRVSPSAPDASTPAQRPPE